MALLARIKHALPDTCYSCCMVHALINFLNAKATRAPTCAIPPNSFHKVGIHLPVIFIFAIVAFGCILAARIGAARIGAFAIFDSHMWAQEFHKQYNINYVILFFTQHFDLNSNWRPTQAQNRSQRPHLWANFEPYGQFQTQIQDLHEHIFLGISVFNPGFGPEAATTPNSFQVSNGPWENQLQLVYGRNPRN